MLPIEWEEKKLEDVCSFYLGLTYTPKYVDSGVPFLSVKDITKGYLSFEKTRYIAREEFESSTSNAKPQRGDIIFGRVGTLGQPLIVETDIDFCIFVSLGLMRVFDNLHNVFLKQWMTSDYFTKQVDSKVIGSAQKNLNIGWLRNFKFPLPPLKEQEKIADILSTADDKIDAITSQIKKTETLKKGLLQKLLSEGIGHSEFKDSEIGKIPKSWEVIKLNDISKITMGQSPKSDTYNTDNIGMPLIQGNADCKNRRTIPRNFTTELTKECFIGDIIMTVRAPVGAISKSLHNACIGRGVCSIKSKEDNEYIYHCLVNYEDSWDKLSQGSTFTAVSGSDIKNLKFPLPPLEEQKQIADILSTADEKLEVLKAKKEKCETLKKGLLQKLLSGEVRV